MTQKKVLLIDADLIAYRNSAAGEERSIEVCHLPTGKEMPFKNKTAFQAFLKAKNFPYVEEDYIIVEVQKPIDIGKTLALIKNQINNLAGFCFADEIELYLGSGETFRHRLELPTPYKGARVDMIKPVHLEAAREYLIKHKDAQVVTGIETDDMLSIRAYEELAKGNIPVIGSIDKDTYQAQGCYVLNWTREPLNEELIPEIGTIYKDKNSYKGTGLKYLAYQTLAGDNADCYCGYDLSTVKYGPVKAIKALDKASTQVEILEVVKKEFQMLYPEPVTYYDCHGDEVTKDWKGMLEMYWKCAYMLRSRDDKGDFWEFEKGIQDAK